jgi:hypothetical protein
LAFVPVWVIVMTFPETTTFALMVSFPAFLQVFSYVLSSTLRGAAVSASGLPS